MGWKEFQDKIKTDSDNGEAREDIWFEALIDLHRWFAEAVSRRDIAQVRQVLDLMQRLDLI